MSIDFHPADYAPTLAGYTGQGPFRFWCQKVLPIVYDDSLSYYELLNKVVVYLNNVISDVATVENNIEEINDSFIDLQGYVNTHLEEITTTVNLFTDYIDNYFDNLDVQNEINNKLNAMASDGSLSRIIGPIVVATVPSIVTAWLNENITPTTPAIDKSLSVSDAAADAKVVGDTLKLKMGAYYEDETEMTANETHTGYYWDGNSYVAGDIYIAKKYLCPENELYNISGVQPSNTTLLVRFYDANGTEVYNSKNFVNSGQGLKEWLVFCPSGATYFIVNGTEASNPTANLVAYTININDVIQSNNENLYTDIDTKLEGVKSFESLSPTRTEEGKLWGNGALVDSQNYTAYMYECNGLDFIRVVGAQPSTVNLLFRFYDENNVEVGNSMGYNTGGKVIIDTKVPVDAEYVWINTIHPTGGYCAKILFDTNSSHLMSAIDSYLDTKMYGVIEDYTELEADSTNAGYLWGPNGLVANANYTAKKYLCDGMKSVHITGVQPSANYLLFRFYDIGGVEMLNSRATVETGTGTKEVNISVPVDSSYFWINTITSVGGNASVPIYNTNPDAILEKIDEDLSKKMNGLMEYENVEADSTQPNMLWNGTELVSNENYTALRFLTSGHTMVRFRCVQPSLSNLGVRFYNELGNEILNSRNLIETGPGSKEFVIEVPENCSYCWVNTMNAYGGGMDDVSYNIDPEHLVATLGGNYQTELTNVGVKVKYGKFELTLRKIGANDIFNIYTLTYDGNVIFATNTDWFGPYNFEKNGGDGDFSHITTGGNHSATQGDITVTTGRTVEWSVKNRNSPITSGSYDSLDIEWHNEIMAGNTVKLDGTGEYCLDEYYRVHLKDGLKLEVEHYFVPRANCSLYWYSGLQFASGVSLNNVIIPAYTDEIITTNDVNSVAIDNKVVERCIAKGNDVQCEMYLDRNWGLASRNVLKSMTGQSNSKMYFTQQGYADEPLALVSGNIYCWRGYYKFTESF